MKSIHTLIPDIYHLLTTKGWFTDELAKDFAHEVTTRLQGQFEERRAGKLRISKLGPQCPHALWCSVHRPEAAEPIQPWAYNKFSYGHIIEAWALCLAKAAGHSVVGEQDELVVDGVVGHRDCVIDGCTVDVKSRSSQGFLDLKKKTIASSDTFGILDQLDGYMAGSCDDPLVLDKEHAYILGIDKTLGHMVLYEHTARITRIRARVAQYKAIVAQETPPKCECGTREKGKSGNIELDVRASYNDFKWECFPHLRAFKYAGGPTFLTQVGLLPDVPEINKYGHEIH